MSYILDALKKAESERKLGSVPNVYATAPDAVATPDDQSWRKWLPWLLAASILIVALFGLAWFQPWRQPAPVVSNPAPAAIVAAPVAVEKPAVATPPVAVEAKPPQIAAPPISTPALQKPVKPAKPPVSEQTAPSMASRHEVATPPVAAAPAKEATAVAAPNEDNSVGTVRDLPQTIQSELPAIVVNGYIYAKSPAERSVLINQKLLHEGDQIAPQLVLEKMLPKGAILNYKGYRYRIVF